MAISAPTPRLQRGSVNLLLVATLAFIAFYGYNSVFVPHYNSKVIESMRGNPATVTIDEVLLAQEYAEKATPSIQPQGLYAYKGKWHGRSVSIRLLFSDDGSTLHKEAMLLGRHLLSASATVHFEGSVMRYSDIRGDRVLFSDKGTPVTVISADELVFEKPESSLEGTNGKVVFRRP
ncbi:hypothetical protein J2T57_001453 [Natronocella acetinitrilica]|uniref:Uncharacterized protein n=1 Tax=Natronocella acetinitrilica TaxID=414046 RepID=A0AAE3G409_9GAMM|nr:hypothetical protein [Natronocella acetinitrilica]MCP1674351.1 hypothetical protein [Natronocella acetinitrilica]